MKNKLLFYILLALIYSMIFIGCRTKTKEVSKSQENIEYSNSEQSGFSNDTESNSSTEESHEETVFESENTEFDEETVTNFDIVKNDDGTYSSIPSKTITKRKGKIDKNKYSNILRSLFSVDSSKSNIDSANNNNTELNIDTSETDKKVEWKVTTKQVIVGLVSLVILFFLVALIYRYRKVIFPFLRV